MCSHPEHSELSIITYDALSYMVPFPSMLSALVRKDHFRLVVSPGLRDNIHFDRLNLTTEKQSLEF